MAKVRTAYRAYTAATLKSRATVPDQADITVVSATIECVDISTMKIRNALGSGKNTDYGNASDSHVNHWSGFGPTVRTVAAGLLVNSDPITGRLGDFAGYNHSAVAPHFDVKGANESVLINPNGSYVFYCVADIGEILYTDIIGVNTITHVAFSVWNGTTYVSSKVKALSGMTNLADFSTNAADRITVSSIAYSTVYTCKIEFLDNVAYDYTGANTVCQVPGLEDWEVEINVQSANHFFLNGPNNDSTEYGYTFSSGRWNVNAASFNTSTGTITINYVQLNQLLVGGYNHLHVTAQVEYGYFDDSQIWIGTAVTAAYDHVYDGVWNTSLSTAFSVTIPLDIWNTANVIDTTGYGYRTILNCNPTTV